MSNSIKPIENLFKRYKHRDVLSAIVEHYFDPTEEDLKQIRAKLKEIVTNNLLEKANTAEETSCVKIGFKASVELIKEVDNQFMKSVIDQGISFYGKKRQLYESAIILYLSIPEKEKEQIINAFFTNWLTEKGEMLDLRTSKKVGFNMDLNLKAEFEQRIIEQVKEKPTDLYGSKRKAFDEALVLFLAVDEEERKKILKRFKK